MNDYKPAFNLTYEITALTGDIAEQVGRISVYQEKHITPKLRRENRLRTIHSSLAIEQNTLSLQEVTAIIDGKRVLGRPNEIQEVKNAFRAYAEIENLNPLSIDDLLKAHALMTEALVDDCGCFRKRGVGVFNESTLIHLAPPAHMVPFLIKDLFSWYQSSPLHPLIKSAVFHYEFEFIHPFEDGNGRMGRMWHSLLLSTWNDLFLWLPVEDMIREQQADYYKALNTSNDKADCAVFVELMLNLIQKSLEEFVSGTKRTDQDADQDTDQVAPSVKRLLEALGKETLSASELMNRLGLSHRQTFRQNYLNPALAAGLIERTNPDKPNSKNQRYRRVNR